MLAPSTVWRGLFASLAMVARVGWYRLPIEEVRFAVLDTELTGLDSLTDELLAVGCIRMLGTRLLLGQTFYRMICPERNAWGKSVPIHRIRPSDVGGAPALACVLEELGEFLQGSVLVGHNVGLDRRFLERAIKKSGFRPLPQLWLDTAQTAAWLASQRGRTSVQDLVRYSNLYGLARRENIEVPLVHHAMWDAFVTAQLWQRQLFLLREHGVRCLGDLALISRV